MPPRNRTPLHFGEGLDRESGLMLQAPTRFQDLRNVLLHEGSLRIRPGFLGAGTGDFGEVDVLLAGEALRSAGLGVIVGYDTTTRRVYVYRCTPDLGLVQLIGEWVHDLPGGWGTDVPRVIMAEVNGRVFLAHDQPFVTRRAPTMWVSDTSGSLTELTAAFAGTTEESAESAESGESQESIAVVPNAIRFRGVVRHLEYLVGWGFGTAAEARPELVRISLPGEPTMFDQNHYKVAGDRNNPVLACGPSGSTGAEGGETLQVWKRNETYAITGYDRRTFGIRLIDSRYGILASRAWVQVGGVAIAWSEEGPRAWQGPAASEPLEIPLGLDEWEADDLVDEGETAYAYAVFVPRARTAWFIFGRRAYVLTARIAGRWRWSYGVLAFDTYGAMTFFAATEAGIAPPGIPVCEGNVPAGTYNDITIGNDNVLGDEVVEIWIREVNSGSGDVDEPETDVFRGLTDLSEFPVGAGLPAGITESGTNNPNAPDTFAIANDLSEGNYLSIDGQGDPDDFDARWLATFDSFDGDWWPGETDIEILARVWVTASVSGLGLAIGHQMGGDLLAEIDATGVAIQKVDPALNLTVDLLNNGSHGSYGASAIADTVQLGAWAWLRFRQHRPDSDWDYRAKLWYGAIGDEPAAWDVQALNAGGPTVGNRMGVFMGLSFNPRIDLAEQRIAFFSWTTDWNNYPPLTPADVPPAFGPWELHSTIAVESGDQVERMMDLVGGQMYEVALRYRRGLLYSPGASDTNDPAGWPSVSRCEFTTVIDPPVIDAAEWSRVDAGTEQIELTITPDDPNADIEVWRAPEFGTPSMLDTISGPHAAQITYQDQTIAGETAYEYYVLTVGSPDSPLSDATRIWSGPATIPVPAYVFPVTDAIYYGFNPGDATLDTEVYDNLPDWSPGEDPVTGPQAFRAFVAAGGTEIVRDSGIDFEPSDSIEWSWKLRHRQTAFTVTDYGEFTGLQPAVWPP